MKQLKDLKQGDEIYDIDFRKAIRYKYLCVHPTGQGNYHILIDIFQEPIRIHGEKLQMILNQDFKSWQEAELALADRLEKNAKDLRKRHER